MKLLFFRPAVRQSSYEGLKGATQPAVGLFRTLQINIVGPLACFQALLLCGAALSAEMESTNLVLPDGLGVNIHFTDPQPGEMKMLAEGGFRWVRMDFGWGGIEKKKGEYDFSAYDRLLEALKPHGIHAVFILDYSNQFYDKGLSPHSDEGRQAFAKWAAESVLHFKGQGILWEMYNEPNIEFWKPKPNVDEYIKLALETGKALRAAAPTETYIGPATSTIDMSFLESCFKAGLLEYWTAVSVHPYRQNEPETSADEYRKVRLLIGKYAPKGKTIPILSGEWGYSSAWANFDAEKQGQMLPRQWLSNLANDIPLSIWYDWHEDGKDPKEAEHHFGTVLNDYHKDADPVYEPKPAYVAAKTLTRFFEGYRFNKCLAMGSPEDHVLLFNKGEEVKLAVWTTSATPHTLSLPVSAGVFQVTGHLGESLASLTADDKGLIVTAGNAPHYLAPEKPNALLRVAAAWTRLPLEISLPGQKHAPLALGLRNPFAYPIQIKPTPAAADQALAGEAAATGVVSYVDVSRSMDPVLARIEWEIKDIGGIAQSTRIIATNPLRATILPSVNGTVVVRVENPSGESFKGTIALTQVASSGNSLQQPLEFKQGSTEQLLSFSFSAMKKFSTGVRIDDQNQQEVLVVPTIEFALMDDFSHYLPDATAYKVESDGDQKIGSQQSLSAALPESGGPVKGLSALKLTYHFDAGWKFVRVVPQSAELKKIDGHPRALGMWVYGDGERNNPRVRFTDSTGQTFQPASAVIDWKGWRYISFPMDGSNTAHWGGANDGTLHYPIQWDTLFLLDGNQRETSGDIYLAAPVLIN